MTLHSKEPLRTIFSPTHNTTIQRKGLHEATASVKAEKWSGTDDFRLYWVADKDDLGLRVLTYRGPDEGRRLLHAPGQPDRLGRPGSRWWTRTCYSCWIPADRCVARRSSRPGRPSTTA